MSAKKENRGGKREGAGRPKVNYKTTTIAFRVRVEWEDEIKKIVSEKILELEEKSGT